MEQVIMIILTAVYVLATIFIWLSNRSSAIATRDQIKESHAQFVDANRAFVNIDFEIVRDGLYVLRIMNNGNRTAQNVKIEISNEFIDIVPNSACSEHIHSLTSSNFAIGIGQAWYVTIGSIGDFETLALKAIVINYFYSDCFSTYCETKEIDISQYRWSLIYNSPINDIRGYVKSFSESVKKISDKISK